MWGRCVRCWAARDARSSRTRTESCSSWTSTAISTAAILERYRQLGRDDLPIRVVVTPEQQERYADLLTQVQVWDHEPSAADLDGFAAQVEASDGFH